VDAGQFRLPREVIASSEWPAKDEDSAQGLGNLDLGLFHRRSMSREIFLVSIRL